MTVYLSNSQRLTLDVEKNNASRAVKKWMFLKQINMNKAVILHQGVKGATNWLNLLSHRLADKSFGFGDDNLVLDMMNIIQSLAGQFYIMLGEQPEDTLAMMVNYFCNPVNSKRLVRGFVDLRLCSLFYDILLRPVHTEKTGPVPTASSDTEVEDEMNFSYDIFYELGLEHIDIATLVDNATPGEVKRLEVAKAYIIDPASDIVQTFTHVLSYIYSVIGKIKDIFEVPSGIGDEKLQKCANNVKVVLEKVETEVKKNMREEGQMPGIAGCICKRDKKTRKVTCTCDTCNNNYKMPEEGVEVAYNEYENIASFPSLSDLCGRGIKPDP